MQRHRWEIDVIWILTAHWCPVGPRVLVTCSEIERANHRWGVWAPPSIQSLIPSTVLGATSSLGLYYYPVLMPCFTALFTIVRGEPVLFRSVTRFRCIDKPNHL